MMGMQGGESSRWKKNTSSNGRRSDDYFKRAKRVLEPVLEHTELVICSNNIKMISSSSSCGPGAPGRCETIKSSSSSSTGNGRPPCQSILLQQTYCNNRRKAGAGKPGLRILSKLRDGYVRLMNDVAVGADLAGVSSFYGAPPAGYGCPALAVDHSPVMSTSPREPPHLSLASHNQSRPAPSL